MKIHTTLFLYFRPDPNKDVQGAIVTGIISSPDRPMEGDTIFWPFGFLKDLDGVEPFDQSSSLTVISSIFFTEAPGRICPTIELEESRNDPNKPVVIEALDYWESVFDGVRLLMPHATVKWPDNSADSHPWPSSAHHLPHWLKQNMRVTDSEE